VPQFKCSLYHFPASRTRRSNYRDVH
jgi:hypothetical protein